MTDVLSYGNWPDVEDEEWVEVLAIPALRLEQNEPPDAALVSLAVQELQGLRRLVLELPDAQRLLELLLGAARDGGWPHPVPATANRAPP